MTDEKLDCTPPSYPYPSVRDVTELRSLDERMVLVVAINRMPGEQRPWAEIDNVGGFTASFAVRSLHTLVAEQEAELQPAALEAAFALLYRLSVSVVSA